YLDPAGLQTTQINGLNPYASEPFTKSHNFSTDEVPVETYFQSVPMFATGNTFGYTEFGEEYHANVSAQLRGVFISSPSTRNASDLNIRIKVYSGENGPTQLLHEQPYDYSYR